MLQKELLTMLSKFKGRSWMKQLINRDCSWNIQGHEFYVRTACLKIIEKKNRLSWVSIAIFSWPIDHDKPFHSLVSSNLMSKAGIHYLLLGGTSMGQAFWSSRATFCVQSMHEIRIHHENALLKSVYICKSLVSTTRYTCSSFNCPMKQLLDSEKKRYRPTTISQMD